MSGALLRRAVELYAPEEPAEFEDFLDKLDRRKLDEWAQSVHLCPEYSARDLFDKVILRSRRRRPRCADAHQVFTRDHFLPLLRRTTPEWRKENDVLLIPEDVSEFLFAECMKKGMTAQDIVACCASIPNSPHRPAIFDFVWETLQNNEDFDVEDIKGMDFKPMPVDCARLAGVKDILPCMQLVSCARARAADAA